MWERAAPTSTARFLGHSYASRRLKSAFPYIAAKLVPDRQRGGEVKPAERAMFLQPTAEIAEQSELLDHSYSTIPQQAPEGAQLRTGDSQGSRQGPCYRISRLRALRGLPRHRRATGLSNDSACAASSAVGCRYIAPPALTKLSLQSNIHSHNT